MLVAEKMSVSKGYVILYIDEYIDIDGQHLYEYCSDGYIRHTQWSGDRDFVSETVYPPEEPIWTTKEGVELTPSEMTPSHRQNVFRIWTKRLIERESKDDTLRAVFWTIALTEADKRIQAKAEKEEQV